MSAEQDLANANVQIANLISEVTRFRDAAMGINNIWPTITEGRQNTADGKYFSVPGSGAYMRLYRRQGSSAELIAEFPDRQAAQSAIDAVAGLGSAAYRDVVGVGDVYARGGILGTVSQFGGVPTGAIIERGSNANGEYTKFADGTLICTSVVVLAQANPSVLVNEWTYPYPFAVGAVASFATDRGNNNDVTDLVVENVLRISGQNANGTRLVLRALRTPGAPVFVSTSSLSNVSVAAIGRWY